jgi:hypothetical protein
MKVLSSIRCRFIASRLWLKNKERVIPIDMTEISAQNYSTDIIPGVVL